MAKVMRLELMAVLSEEGLGGGASAKIRRPCSDKMRRGGRWGASR
jgi:hypothetical protein